MTAREFLIEWFEIEPERYEQEGEICIKDMINDESIDKIIWLMNSYAEYKIKQEMSNCEY